MRVGVECILLERQSIRTHRKVKIRDHDEVRSEAGRVNRRFILRGWQGSHAKAAPQHAVGHRSSAQESTAPRSHCMAENQPNQHDRARKSKHADRPREPAPKHHRRDSERQNREGNPLDDQTGDASPEDSVG
jgi:hypothetical protein